MGMLSDVVNIGGRGMKMRRKSTKPIFCMVLAALGAVLLLNASPAWAFGPITALLVVEYEVRAAFCVLKGLAPGQSCKKPGFSRSVAIGVVAASAAIAFALTHALELVLGCTLKPKQYLLPPLGPYLAGSWTCDA
jgi:hypothetical protein